MRLANTKETAFWTIGEQRKEIDRLHKELSFYKTTEKGVLRARSAALLAALKMCEPILRVAHDRGFAISEIEPVYNAVVAAIEAAEGE